MLREGGVRKLVVHNDLHRAMPVKKNAWHGGNSANPAILEYI